MPDDGIDFVPSHSGGEPGDELLDADSRSRRPRWLLPVAIAALLVIALLVVQHQHSSAPSAAPSSDTTRSLPQRFRPIVTPSGGPDETAGGYERPIDRGANVLDVLVSADTWWELKSRSITRWGQFGIQARAQLPVPVTRQDRPKLVLDLSTQTIWLVELQRRNSTLYSFENVTMLPRQVVHLATPIWGAVSLQGRLFVVDHKHLIEVSRHGRPTVIASKPRGGFDSLEVDSARGGLLIANYGAPTLLWRATVGAGGAVRMARPVQLPISKATLAAVNGAIWIGGFSDHGAVLDRLDPTTLQPTTRSPLTRSIGPGAVLVADGVLDVWVRDAYNGKLYCMDSAAGNPLQTWMIAGAVSSGGGNALVATQTGMIPLALRSCSG